MLDKFIEFVDRNSLKVDSIILTKKGKKYEHYFIPESRNNIRSISKVVSCLGVYKAIQKGIFTLESHVLPFFDDVTINKRNFELLKELKIKHLLNLTTGHEDGLMFSKDIKKLPKDTDYISFILNYEIKHEPGTYFVYNNAATYLLCDIIQRKTSMKFSDWIYESIFKFLDISKPKWEESHQGICLGASGLYLNNDEMHKIGLLLLENGFYKGQSIIDSSWIDKMHTPQFFTANLPEYKLKQGRCINKMAYGYHLWISGNGSHDFPKTHYFIDGTDGQFLIVSPKDQMVITILSHQKDMSPFYEILNEYIK